MKDREIFLSALEITDPAARQEHLQRACGDDHDLLARVAALLASHEGPSQFLKTPVVEQIAHVPEPASTIAGALESAENAATDIPGTAPVESTGETTTSDRPDRGVSLDFLGPASRSDSLGRLGHYEILEVIGRGAFGTVLRAFDEKLQRVVAIKVLAPELASTSPARKRFLREAQASAAIRHEHVVSIYAVEEQPTPYLVMEYIPGQTLQERLDEHGPLDIPNVLRLGRQIAEGLAAAHARDLIHRDIKPGNILLETGVEDRVKITDFGLARTADDASLTQSGTIAGTPLYMAPEQALGQSLDQRADLFSFGSVLYQMVSGRPPFRAPTALAVLKRVVEETPRPITEIIPETPQWLCNIIGKLHAKQPEDRFQSAREVAALLADCESRLKSHARSSDFVRLMSSTTPRRNNRTSIALAWVAGVVGTLFCVSLLLAGIWYLYATTTVRITRVESNAPQGQNQDSRLVVNVGETNLADGTLAGTETAGWYGWPDDAPLPAVAPFDAEQAREHQAAWADYLGIPVEFTDRRGIRYVLIPPGEFLMGFSPEELDTLTRELKQAGAGEFDLFSASTSGPQHKVCLTKPFYLSAHEITVGEFRKFVEESRYISTVEQLGVKRPKWTEYIAADNPDSRPVVGVSWTDAEAYCVLRSQADEVTYRLPSEAEWEFACRAGTTTLWSFGNHPGELSQYAVTSSTEPLPVEPVGTRKPNPFGLYDMYGNAEEWCRDWHVRDYYGHSPLTDPANLESPADRNSGRVTRGGGPTASLWQTRSSTRRFDYPSTPVGAKGFRVALTGDIPSAVQRLTAPE
ncbi:MAG: SUMF1/EgtB/PvdO family nonheme iron enzyme [Planctomycetes bacterium]|nr:SUMF1/EgtB/PvdO family nonheme iron enzyme [Planctomycetota bacterium]